MKRKRKRKTWLDDPHCYAAGLMAMIRTAIDMAPPGFNKKLFILNLVLQVLPPQLPMTYASEAKDETQAQKDA